MFEFGFPPPKNLGFRGQVRWSQAQPPWIGPDPGGDRKNSL